VSSSLWKQVSLSIRVLWGTWRGKLIYWGLYERQVKQGYGNEASLSMGAMRGEPGRRVSF
jgi:hypothetical protein